ncbi:WcaI family glycosyltransferase [Parasphingorhabdus sp.]|uniref:WcaI family glycosyltransferase n=1 Tax=Parasphingorhabdus sp. TaxID=2709688 RepID=UPI00300179E3
MKILILGINYAPELTGIAVYTAGLAQDLVARGHAVEVVTAPPYYPDWQVAAGHSPWRYASDRQAGVQITRCPIYVPRNPSGPKRILHHLSFAITSLFPMIASSFRMRPDIIFTVSPSLFSAPIGALAARMTGAKQWLHIQDFEVEAAFATGQINSQDMVKRWAHSFEHFCLSLPDKVSSISSAMCQKLLDKGVASAAVYQLNNWADDATIKPKSHSLFRSRWNIATDHVALYSGSISEKQGLENVIEAARRLKNREDITFVICGNGPNRGKLEKCAADLKNIQFHGLQKFEDLNDLLSLATIHLLPQKRDAADLLLPSKLANMLASGRPVVAGAEAGTGLAVAVAGCGLIVEPDSPDAMAKAIVNLMDDSILHSECSKAARRRSLQDWSKEQIIFDLERAFAQISGADKFSKPVGKSEFSGGAG